MAALNNKTFNTLSRFYKDFLLLYEHLGRWRWPGVGFNGSAGTDPFRSGADGTAKQETLPAEILLQYFPC